MTAPDLTIRKAPESWRINTPGASFTLSRLDGLTPDVLGAQGYRWGEQGAEPCPVEQAELVRLHEHAEPGHEVDFGGLGLAAAQQVLEAAHKGPVHRVEAQRRRDKDLEAFMNSIGC